MSDAPTGWIKFSERSPRDSEFTPEWIWLWADNKPSGILGYNPPGCRMLWEMRAGLPADKGWTHWMPAVVPEPPKRPLTQTEVDAETFADWRNTNEDEAHGRTQYEAWKAALAWERDEVRAIIGGNAYELESDRLQIRLPVEVFSKLATRIGLGT